MIRDLGDYCGQDEPRFFILAVQRWRNWRRSHCGRNAFPFTLASIIKYSSAAAAKSFQKPADRRQDWFPWILGMREDSLGGKRRRSS